MSGFTEKHETNKFKNSSGAWLTKALFYEVSYDRLDHLLFTMKPEDFVLPSGEVLTSFPKLYIALCIQDPTEATLADLVFGGHEHWKMISESASIKPYVESLREEVSVRIKSEALSYLLKEVREGGKSAYQSARYLLDKGVLREPPKGLSRQEAKERNDILNQKAQDTIEDDATAARIGLTLVRK